MVDPVTLTNVTNLVANQAVQDISGQIQEKILWAFFKYVAMAFSALGAKATDIRELKIALQLLVAVLGILGTLDVIQAILMSFPN